MNNSDITYAKRLAYTKYGLEKKSIFDVLEMIRRGDMTLNDPEIGEYDLKTVTEVIRSQSDPVTQNEWKTRFIPVVFFNGIWNGSKICEYSSVTALDFDHIRTDDELNQTIDQLKSTSFVLAIFRTFKPRRIKALILHDNVDPTKHTEMYQQLIDLFGITLLDICCKDLSRKTFLLWDEDIWINPNCDAYRFVPSLTSQQITTQTKIGYKRGMNYQGTKSKSPQSIINILNSFWRREHPEYWQRGNRASSIFKCACQFCEYGIPQDMAETYFIKNWEEDDMTNSEITGHVNGAYRSAVFDSKVFF